MINYLEVVLENVPEDLSETLTAMLMDIGYESFSEENGLFSAFIVEADYDESRLRTVLSSFDALKEAPFRVSRLENKNWNEAWESNFEPVLIDGRCLVRAPFHEAAEGVEYDLCIMPKMSFGTAHHETTSQVISMLMDIDVKGKRVLDMGSGTGVLAILASKMGAGEIFAIDNDEWAYENAKENTEKNNTPNVNVILGDSGSIPAGSFDIILANINRNILLEQMSCYSASMNPGSILVLSGFYEEDLDVISKRAAETGLHLLSTGTKNRWMVAKFEK
jgi:ribosomal protein L11 methyltransferase